MNRSSRKRVGLVTLGSLGDLHPCLALGIGLKSRGVNVKVITTEFYRSRVERAGLDFGPMRPDWDPTDPELVAQCDDLKKGPEILFRRVILPHLPDTYEDLLREIQDVDLMIAGELVYAAPLVAEKLGLRWASLILSPASFFSINDPPLMVNAPWMLSLRKAGMLPYKVAFNFARAATKHWWRPVHDLRVAEGLRRSCDPLVKDKFSPDRVLALFSSWLAQPQPDWPKQTVQPGFLFHDGEAPVEPIRTEVERHLDAHGAPIVFTLGSTAVADPGDFYRSNIEVTKRLGASGILIGATRTCERVAEKIPSVPYLPYSQIFPKASVIVHQGGSGTTAQALLSGRPMLFVPWGWDQPDNAMRAERRGSALSIRKDQYSVRSAMAALNQLRTDVSFAKAAGEAREHVRNEPGLAEAVKEVMAMLG